MADLLPASIKIEPPPPPGFSPVEPTPPPGYAEPPPPAGFAPLSVGPAESANPNDWTLDRKIQAQRYAQSKTGNESINRVIDAFGQGAKAGFGSEPLGLSTETVRSLRETGNEAGGLLKPFTAFEEMLLRPLAFTWDLATRSFNAVAGGAGAAISQVSADTGTMNLPPDPAAAAEQAIPLAAVAQMGMIGGAVSMRMPPELAPVRATLLQQAEDAGVLRERAPVLAEAPISLKPAIEPGKVDIAPGSAANDTAGNINLKNINTPDDVKDVIRETANSRVIAFGESSPFIDARRGVMTHETTQELAQLTGTTYDTLAKRKVGQAFNAEEALAARNLLVQSAQNVKELAGKTIGGSDQALLDFEEAVTRHVAIQEQVAGMTAEAGRALQSFRIQAGETIDVKGMLERAGGRDKIEAMAQALNTMTPEEASAALPGMRKATTVDMIKEFWVNGLLSSPTTHQANMIGNLLTSVWRVPEQYAAATAGLFHGGDKVSFREANATAFGLIHGVRDGLIAGWKALKSGEPSDAASKLEQQKFRAIPGWPGEVIRIPGRLLMTEDEFFKSMNSRASINALAVRTARKEGLDGKALLNRIAELKAAPTDKMLAKAREEASYYSFQSELGDIGKTVMRLRNQVPGLSFVVPFIKTPANIMKYAAERSPLAGFTWFFESSPVGKALRGELGAPARDIAMTRMAIGTGVGIGVSSLAAEGLITGNGPQDPRQRATLYASGWLPYSVKIGDKWHSYNRYDPFGLLMGVWADLHEMKDAISKAEADKIAAMTVASVSNALINKTWLSGPAQLMAALNDPERYGDQYVRQFIGTAIPGIANQMAREIDPVARDARTMTDQIMTRIPWMSQQIAPKRDIFGEPIVREGDAFTVGTVSTIRQDPVVNELLTLGVYPAKLERQIKGVDLTVGQYDEYQTIAGRLMKVTLNNAITQPGWDKMPLFARQEIVTNLISSSRAQGQAYMLMKYPAIIEAAIKAKTTRFTQ